MGPELFYVYLRVLEETGFFNASLYSPYSIAGIETLGHELVAQVHAIAARAPSPCVGASRAGGGPMTAAPDIAVW